MSDHGAYEPSVAGYLAKMAYDRHRQQALPCRQCGQGSHARDPYALCPSCGQIDPGSPWPVAPPHRFYGKPL